MYHANPASATVLPPTPARRPRGRTVWRIARALVAGVLFGFAANPACVPRNALGHARSLAWQGREQAAVASLREHLSAHPHDTDARRLLVRMLGNEQPRSADT